MERKHRKIVLGLLMIYTILILFFLFFSFNRRAIPVDSQSYHFNLVPNLIHLRFPNFSNVSSYHLYFFNLGNFIGFIPFGILIPLLYPCKFRQFISLFFLSILLIEIVQMLTYLGRFDINDALVNTLGAAVGFLSYKIGVRYKNVWKKIAVMLLTAAVFSLAVIGFSELLNKQLTKVEGPQIALNELESDGIIGLDKNLLSFEIGNDKITPEINLYSNIGEATETFTYAFEGKDIVLSLNYGIPNHASDSDVTFTLSIDGEEWDAYSGNNEDHYFVSSEYYLENVNELTITLTGDIKLWDVAYSEMVYWWE